MDKVPTQGDYTSFVGGLPRIPKDEPIPVCGLCGSLLSFFFQLAFPPEHIWGGNSLAVFACSACSDVDHFIPATVSGALAGTNVASEFLRAYQTNFRFLVFPSFLGIVREDYVIKVKFKPILLRQIEDGVTSLSKVGGTPVWIGEDEHPTALDGKDELIFLFQLEPNIQFEIVEGAPAQIEYNMLYHKMESLPERFYRLFIGNGIYAFGPRQPSELVYVFTQVD